MDIAIIICFHINYRRNLNESEIFAAKTNSPWLLCTSDMVNKGNKNALFVAYRRKRTEKKREREEKRNKDMIGGSEPGS